MEFSEDELLDVDPDYNLVNSEPSTSCRTKNGKKPHHYTDAEDISILKEVLLEKATRKGATSKWKAIFDRLGIPVKDYKAIKTRFDVLYNAFKKDENIAFRGSGLEEDYDEKKRLMTEICMQMEEWILPSPATQGDKKKDDSNLKAKEIREASLFSLRDPKDVNDEGDSHATPKRKRINGTTNDFYEMIRKSEESEQENKKLMMELETKRIEIMERESQRQEKNDQHRREMERRQMLLEEKRVEMELKRIELENHRAEKDQKEREIFLQILQQRK